MAEAEVHRENPHSTRETGRLCTERLGRRSQLGVFLLGGNKANQSVGRDLKLGVLKACKTELNWSAQLRKIYWLTHNVLTQMQW